MKDKMTKNISVAKITSVIVNSRHIVNIDLKKTIDRIKVRNINLDFNNIEFISRSASHALLILKEDLLRKTPKKELNFTNMTKEVERMIKIVAVSKAVPKKEVEFKPENISIGAL